MSGDVEELRGALEALLERLPGTEMEVAAFLYGSHCKGKPDCPEGCPLAKWLTKELGRYAVVCAYNVRVVEHNGEELNAIAILPQHVREFVMNFDQGKHPELIEEGK